MTHAKKDYDDCLIPSESLGLSGMLEIFLKLDKRRLYGIMIDNLVVIKPNGRMP